MTKKTIVKPVYFLIIMILFSYSVCSLNVNECRKINDVIIETGDNNFSHLNITSSAPYDSLVAYYSFDGDKEKTKLTTAYDYSKYNHDGTYTGDANASSDGCLPNFGECAQFDGNGDYIQIPLTPDLNTSSGTTWTLSAWIKPVNLFNGHYYISNKAQYSAPIGGMMIYTWNNAFQYRIYDSSGNSTYSQYGELSASTWYHVVGVYNGTYTLLYLNGDLKDFDPATSTPLSYTDLDWYIGSSSESPATTLSVNGSMDEVMIFNTALTETQISEIYNNQSSRFKVSGRQNCNNQTLLNISSGNNKVNVTTVFNSDLGSALNLSVDYYDGFWHSTIPQTLSSGINSSFSISPTSTNLTFNYTLIAGTDNFYTSLVIGKITFSVYSTDIIPPSVSITYPENNSNFNTSIIIFNATINEEPSLCGLSIDGNKNATMSLSGNSTGFINNSVPDGCHSFVVSCEDLAGLCGNSDIYYFLVDTSYPSISFLAPTPNDSFIQTENYIIINVTSSDTNNISLFIDSDDSIVSWWRFDEGNGSVDYFGRNNGVINGDAHQNSTGKAGKAFDFDGYGDYLNFGDSPSLEGMEEATFSGWIKTTKGDTNFIIKSSSYMINIPSLSDNIILSRVYNSSGSYTGCTNAVSGGTWKDGLWHHFVISANGTHASLYEDGIKIDEGDCLFDSVGTSSNSFILGGSFNGSMDDVMIFNRSLSAEEIKTLYANQSSKNLIKNIPLSDGTHFYKAYSQDIAGNVNSTEERTIIIDNEIPVIDIIFPLNNTEQENEGHLLTVINLTDNNDLYNVKINFTHEKLFLGTVLDYEEEINISGANYLYYSDIDTSSFANDTMITMNVRCCDSHTSGIMRKTPKIAVRRNILEYKFGKDSIYIESLNDASEIRTERGRDRYTFSFDYLGIIQAKEYEIWSTSPIDYIENSDFKGHFVIPSLEVWIDFEQEGDVSVNRVCREENDDTLCKYRVYVYNNKPDITFRSIGELNCITKSYQLIFQKPEGFSVLGFKWDFDKTSHVILIFSFIILYIGVMFIGFFFKNFGFTSFGFLIGIVLGLFLTTIHIFMFILFTLINVTIFLKYAVSMK